MVTGSDVGVTQESLYPVVNFGDRIIEVKKVIAELEREDVVNRIWHKDYTVWKPDPMEIINRLGWLQITDTMADRMPELEAFAEEIKQAGFHSVVLLGMGGSSLGPEVLRQVFGSGPGFPTLMILDSTSPSSVEAVARAIEPQHTLFLVSSKSGTTTETLSFYRYFRQLVEKEIGENKAGSNFVAITDARTPLSQLAEEAGFRRTFYNPEDIGGRYSVLSYFGLVPAALSGVDIRSLIDRADRMQVSCAPCVNIGQNPGVWLGAMMGKSALQGRDKLTLITSPSIRSFSLWAEQLIAESTGKEGKGIIPIIDEPMVDPKYYGDDRLLVYLRMKGDKNEATDKFVERLEVSGQPIIQLEMKDQYDLGAEYFRWEFAAAVAGKVLGINPFDQPDVQSAKDATNQVLQESQASPDLWNVEKCEPLERWTKKVPSGSYLAITAYMKQTPSTDKAFSLLRQRIMQSHRIATTLGYGPRFLHSTGQLHKGGPNKGLFLQITADRRKDLRIPGEPYSFGELIDAQALGDLKALQSRGRKVGRIQLQKASGTEIQRIE